jgi:hypothetical protein
MNGWMRWSLAAVGAVIGGTAAASAVGGSVWNRQTERMLERLADTPSNGGPTIFSPDELQGLPAPVVRYFAFALTPGQPLIGRARIEHAGEFRGGLDAAWSPFRSVQHFSVNAPGMIWDAQIHMAPLVTVRVRDSYLQGRAGMLARVAGLVPVVDEEGTPHLNSGALHRYFLESAWFPTALLPSQGIRWEPIDDSSARATLSDSGITLSMDVHFGEQGEIVRVEAERLRDVNGHGVPTPFVGHVHRYERVDGMMIPIEGEVEWILPEGRFSFWRGRITDAKYDYVL